MNIRAMKLLDRLGFGGAFQSLQFMNGKYIELFCLADIGVAAIRADEIGLNFYDVGSQFEARGAFLSIPYTLKNSLSLQQSSIWIRERLCVYDSYTIQVSVGGYPVFIVANRFNFHKNRKTKESTVTPNLVPFRVGGGDVALVVREENLVKPLSYDSLDRSFSIFTPETAKALAAYYQGILPKMFKTDMVKYGIGQSGI